MAWQEHPSPAFIISILLVVIGIGSGILGLAGVFNPAPPNAAAGLIGLSASTTRDLLGQPRVVRQEPPAEVWQYTTDTCVLDVYLYPAHKGPTVQYAEAREQTTGCVETLRMAALQLNH